MPNRLDIVIFGASGYTGKATVFEAVKILANKKLTWGIAGRNKDKLREVIKEASNRNGMDLSNIPIILADVNDIRTLDQMAQQAKVLVNCCGPFRFYGEEVVKACLNAGTHHVDISGEVQFIEGMQLKYNDLAKEKGLYIISACGFDSMPAEMGIIFFEKHFDGQVNSIESYLLSWLTDGYKGSATGNYGTWESAIYSFMYAKEIGQIRKKLFTKRLPKLEPKIPKRESIHKSPENLWCIPFPQCNQSVVARTQRFLHENEQKRPIQYQEYLSKKSIFEVYVMILAGIIFKFLIKYSFGRKLLLNHPKIFSLGKFSQNGPSEKIRKRTKFSLTFYGEGWPKEMELPESTNYHTTPPTKKLITRIIGTDPGYASTGKTILLSAATILNERTKMPGNGGVLSPGAAFINTNLIDEMSKNGFSFEVVSTNSIR